MSARAIFIHFRNTYMNALVFFYCLSQSLPYIQHKYLGVYSFHPESKCVLSLKANFEYTNYIYNIQLQRCVHLQTQTHLKTS